MDDNKIQMPDSCEGIGFLVDLGRNQKLVQEVAGHQYHVNPQGAQLIEYQPKLPEVIKVNTLSALTDLVEAGFEGMHDTKPGEEPETLICHVATHTSVTMISSESDEFGRRPTFAQATPIPVDGHKFGEYYSHEKFIISLLANFQPTEGDDLDYLLRVADTITGEAVVKSENTGAGQMVSLRAGALVNAEKSELKQRVKLAPYRTFREIDQPVSEFVFRVKQEEAGQVPKLVLIEADGGKWKIDAMEKVAARMRVYFAEIKVVA